MEFHFAFDKIGNKRAAIKFKLFSNCELEKTLKDSETSRIAVRDVSGKKHWFSQKPTLSIFKYIPTFSPFQQVLSENLALSGVKLGGDAFPTDPRKI
jgi:hypothetical protein